MFNTYTHYYELLSENKLPPNSEIIDPIDNTAFHVETTDNLTSLCEKMSAARKKRNLPPVQVQQFKTFITLSLVEQCPLHLRDTYFRPVAISPEFGQIISLSKAVLQEWKSDKSTSTQKRQNRARHCIVCPLHKRSAEAPEVPPSLLDRFGFASLAQSLYYPEEQALGVCGMCGCGLKTKVKADIRSSLAGITPENLDLILNIFGPNAFEVCWILKECIEASDTKKILQAKLRAGNSNGEVKLHEYLSEKANKALNQQQP